LQALAVVLEEPKRLDVRGVGLRPPEGGELVVRTLWTGVSTGTERLLWTGSMPPFPGLGYPLVPGYEAVGVVEEAPDHSAVPVGTRVFVPGSTAFEEVRGLFGAAASRLVVPAHRVLPLPDDSGSEACLLALAATAYHALQGAAVPPELIVGHGAFGRLLARLVQSTTGGEVTVWEQNPVRMGGGEGYTVCTADDDPRRDYRSIVDASGDPGLIDTLVERLAPQGEITLAGFYQRPVSFSFPPAFLREARFRIAAEWRPEDLAATGALVLDGALSLDGLVTHRYPAVRAGEAYGTAFEDPSCVKMTLDWSNTA
jgi:bacteriochlorophyllide a dehydrogenase